MSGVPHPQPISGVSYSAAELSLDNQRLILLEQRKLPLHEEYVELRDVDAVALAIREMVVRGAPAIGISAAYGMVLAAGAAGADFDRAMALAAATLKAARPTAVNLFWAVDRMLAGASGLSRRPPGSRVEELAELAREIHREDVAANRELGRLGALRVPDGASILTHCNAGALATGGYGTALGVIRAAREANKKIRVFADETRPYLQGSRLTAWELTRDGIDVSVIADSAAGLLFARGEIDLVVVGSDRIARNGDVANKIGTYTVACLARAHGRPFYVAAPWSTVDLRCPAGDQIPIEERSQSEISQFDGRRLVPAGASIRNPAFDVTPSGWVSAIFTERGVVEPVSEASLLRLGNSPARTSLDLETRGVRG